jgi:methylglutaconyl-CoA hydratase
MSETTRNAVLIETGADGVARITLNRPEVHNAVDEAIIAGLKAALAQAADDAAVRAVVIAGNGESFCAGADLNWMKRSAAYDEAQNVFEAAEFAASLQLLREMPKPSIARVHGAAYGGGVGIVAACDVAIGARGAQFSFSEVRLGLIPAMISPYAIAAIGERHARRYMLSAERIDAGEALRLGLLHDVCDETQLDERIGKLTANLLRGGPAAIAACKALIEHVAGAPVDSGMRDYTARAIASIRASEEGKEGVAAFLEKRAPRWIASSTKGSKS